MSRYTLHLGDCLETLRGMPDNSVDSIVTDPPYGLSKEPDMAEVMRHWLAGDDYQHKGVGFMGKTWDSFVPGPSVWRECLRVLKPVGHLLAFFGSRTYDMGTLAIRLAGFEIRDMGGWLYGSGFPKSHNLEGEWEGWGSALKPAHEPIAFARKPFKGTLAASRKDRHEGLEDPGAQFQRGTTLRQVENTATTGNNHPTVKPTDLMAYLCRLVTPPGGVVLDPFTGSGSTGKAAIREGFNFIGCELSPEYLSIAEARIAHEICQKEKQQDLFSEEHP